MSAERTAAAELESTRDEQLPETRPRDAVGRSLSMIRRIIAVPALPAGVLYVLVSQNWRND